MSSQNRNFHPVVAGETSIKPRRVAKESENLKMATDVKDRRQNLFETMDVKDKTLKLTSSTTAAETFARPDQPRYQNMDPLQIVAKNKALVTRK